MNSNYNPNDDLETIRDLLSDPYPLNNEGQGTLIRCFQRLDSFLSEAGELPEDWKR